MAGSLSREQIQHYNDYGHLYPLRGMTEEQAASYLAKVEAFEREYGARGSEILRSKSHLVLSWVDEIIRLPHVLDAAESLLGPNIYCWSTSFFIKNARDPGFIAWHQDAPFSGMPDGEILTAWIALSPSTEANGCLQVVGGSQTKVVPHEHKEGTQNMLSAGQEIAVDVDPEEATKMELRPGEFSFHHHMIIHGSAPNSSDMRRVGIAVRYVRPMAPRSDGEKDVATLVRGKDPLGGYEQAPTPRGDMHADDVRYLDDLLKKKFGTRYRKAS
jgi:hypothetical protein